jgi:hypothetical protein
MQFRRSFALLVSRVSLALALGALVLFTLLGTLASPTHAAPGATPAYVRIIHASPDVGTADVFLDGNKLLSSFAFGSITDYAPIPPGPHKVQIALVGKGIGASALTQTLDVQPGMVYTAAAIGTAASGLSIEVFSDNNIIAAGKAKLRMYNLSPDAGAVSLSSGGQSLISSVTYQQASDYTSLASGSYSFNVSSASVSLPLSESLPTNTVTSIFVVGLANGSPRIELSPAQVNGVPGLPGTGSDPAPLPDTVQSQPVAPWIVAILLVALLSASFLLRRIAHSR